jgi:thiamine pyrophosphate-dependent acetolactate synthase large subunit-like protein
MGKSDQKGTGDRPCTGKGVPDLPGGRPGPVFLEIPIDCLYQHSAVKEWTLSSGGGKGLLGKATDLYLRNHVRRTFAGAWETKAAAKQLVVAPIPQPDALQKVLSALKSAEKPMLIVGSQALLDAEQADALQAAVRKLGIPTFLSGMARGLLGRDPLHIRHKRGKALREADVVIVAGVPLDFRLGYGRAIPRRATHIGINRSKADLTQNKKPDIGVIADPGKFLRLLAEEWVAGTAEQWAGWTAALQARNDARDREIQATAEEATEFLNPVWVAQQVESVIAEDSVIIGDGGDFVATASYIVRPRGPLSWLDPGAFGTLGAGGGFALAAKLCRPTAEVWLLYGDGAAGFSLAEFDTMARHGIPVIGVIGNDASWAQIARDQVVYMGSSLATDLARTAYHQVAEGYGGVGFCVERAEELLPALEAAKGVVRRRPSRPRQHHDRQDGISQRVHFNVKGVPANGYALLYEKSKLLPSNCHPREGGDPLIANVYQYTETTH